MFKILKESELGSVASLIEGGLTQASEAMGSILQSPIEIKKIDYEVDELQFSKKSESPIHLLRTQIMGDLEGVSYLILCEDEVQKIIKDCLPPSLLSDEEAKKKMMTIGFLTELDNMVAAAVITRFSDRTGLELYGQVPELIVLDSQSKVNIHIEKEATNYKSILHFKAIFNSPELDISPDFIWMVEEEFLNKINNLT